MADWERAIGEILERSGAQRRTAEGGDEIYLKRCPECGNENWKFNVNPQKGAWLCFVCNKKGGVLELASVLGVEAPKLGNDAPRRGGPSLRVEKAADTLGGAKKTTKVLPIEAVSEWEKALWRDADALAYVRSRGFTDQTIRRFRIGLSVSIGKRWLAIPHLEGGLVMNAKLRSLPPAEKSFRRTEGCATVLFNWDCLAANPKEVFVCEAELDACSLWQLGFENVVSSTAGSSSFDPAWAERLAKCERVYVVYDRDRAGQAGAFERARQIGLDRTWNVLIPEPFKDVNELLAAGGTREQMLEVVEAAERFDVDGVVSVGKAIRQLYEEALFGDGDDAEAFASSGFENVDKLLGKFQPGDLIGLCANAKTGKTSLALQISSENAARGRGVIFACMEMPVKELARKIVQCELQTAKENLTAESFSIAQARLRERQFYLSFLPQITMRTLPDLLSFLRDAVRRYGVRIIVFDHLHVLIRGSMNPEQDTAAASLAFKKLATDEGVVVILIVQPRKTDAGTDVTMRDMKYTSSLGADMDRMIFLNRREIAGSTEIDEEGSSSGSLSPLTKVSCTSRYAEGGTAWLAFEGSLSRFRRLQPGEVQDVRNIEREVARAASRGGRR